MSNETEREAFEAEVQYRQFLGRHKDGTYEHDWVELRWQGWQARAAYQRTQAQPADALVEALELLYRKLKPNVNGADETYFFIGLRDQVTERQMERISEALATYRAAQEKK